MNGDPIIDDVRAIRDAMAREHHYDLDSIFRMLRAREMTSGRPHVTLPPTRPPVATSVESDKAAPQGAPADAPSRRG